MGCFVFGEKDGVFFAAEQEFDELCFDYGLELDDVVMERANANAPEEEVYKVELPANRYDLLCVEGLARALRVFTEV